MIGNITSTYTTTSWPTDGDARAGSFILRIQQACGPERILWYWFDSSMAPSTMSWPGSDASVLTPVAQVVPETQSIIVTRQDLAQEDLLLADLPLTGVPQSFHATAGSPRGGDDDFEYTAGLAVARALKDVIDATPSSLDSLPARLVTSLPADECDSQFPAHMDLVSWHAMSGDGSMLRALERLDPVVDLQSEGMRARRFLLLSQDHRTRETGELILESSGAARWWPYSHSPWIDTPAHEQAMPTDVRHLLELIRD